MSETVAEFTRKSYKKYACAARRKRQKSFDEGFYGF